MRFKQSKNISNSFIQWRQFTFFDAVPVKDIHDLDSTPDIFKVSSPNSPPNSPVDRPSLMQATPEISTVKSSSFGVLVADIHGSIHLLNRDFESINSWVAHVGGRVTHMVERRGVLVTLGVGPDVHDEVFGC